MSEAISRFASGAKRRLPFLLLVAGIGYWPVFAVLTILDEKQGVAWLRTESIHSWLPVAAIALASALIAPLLSDLSVVRKAMGVCCALVAYAAAYGLVVLVGTSFLGWAD